LFDVDLQRLLHRIYETGCGDLEVLLDEVKCFLEGSAIALISHNFKYNRGSIRLAKGYNPRYIQSYALHHAHHNVWLARERDYRPPGKVHIGEDLVPENQLVQSKFYREWLRPQDLHHRLCAVLSRDDTTAVSLEVMRPRQWAAFDQDDIERCRSLLPLLQRALLIHRRMAELELERDAAFRALDQLPWGVFFIDEHHNRLGANRHAQEILAAGDGLIARGNTLQAELADETARLDQLLRSALNRPGQQKTGLGGTLSITRPSGAHPLNVVVVPLHVRTEALGERGSIAAIFVTDPEAPLDGSIEQHLRELYALTAGEARLASWLLKGKSVEEAAAAMGITVNTARAYLKRVYNKTGVRRQPELVRLLLLGLPRLRGNMAAGHAVDRATKHS
jgi:DNA-binding CsgD family transcriptional regulator/PAS domain-containing protein